MTEELKAYLQKVLHSIDGLHAIIITDRDGVSLIKVADENAPELALRGNFLFTLCMATEQAGKLKLGQNKSIVCVYDNYQVLHISKHPLLLTLIAKNTANTGLLSNLEKELNDVLADVSGVLQTA